MITNEEKHNLEELIQLMQQHPELPVVPVVDEEVAFCDDNYWSFGSWGYVRIDDCLQGKRRGYLKSGIEHHEDVLIDCSQVDYETLASMTTEEIEAAFNRLPWTTAILGDIDKPDRRKRYA